MEKLFIGDMELFEVDIRISSKNDFTFKLEQNEFNLHATKIPKTVHCMQQLCLTSKTL